jgi:acetyl esterase/lipase
VLVLLLVGIGLVLWARPSPPDDFYAAPADLEEAAPGTLLRSEPFTRGLPGDVRGWRVLYRSTDAEGEPVAVSGLLMEPRAPAPEPRPLIAIAHGSTGVSESCAPSLAARPLASLAGVERALDAGFAVVATDYLGLGTPGPHPYLIGSASAHAVLDSLRTAPDLVDVDPEAVAVWGFSQGGHAALFAGQEAPTYAPDLDLRGVVTFAPATDLTALVEEGHGTVVGTLTVVSAAVAWSEAREDLDLTDVVAPASADTAREIAERCLDPTSLPVSTIQSVVLRDEVSPLGTSTTAHWAPFLVANTPTGDLEVPLLVLQGAEDPIVRAEITARDVRRRCEAGEVVDLRVIPGVGHFTLGSRTDDDAVAWTTARFDGEPAPSTC